MALRDIIKDLPDEAEVQVGENKVRVGDLRGEMYDPEKFVARDDYTKLNSQHQELGNGILNFLNRAAAATTDTMNQSGGNGQPPEPVDMRQQLRDALGGLLQQPGYDYSKDGYVTPAMNMAREQAVEAARKEAEEKYATRIARLEEDNKAIARQSILAEENSWWRINKSDLPKRPDGNTYTLDDLRQLAMANNVKDSRGYPDYDRLKDALLQPTRQAAHEDALKDEAYKRGLADARKASAASIVDIPGRGFMRAGETKPIVETKGKTAQQIINESLSAAFEDQDILNLAGQA